MNSRCLFQFRPTRIVSTSWEHSGLSDLRINIDDAVYDGIIVEFGDGRGNTRTVGLSDSSLNENTYRVFLERQYQKIIRPVSLVGLNELNYTDGLVVGGKTATGDGNAVAAAFVISVDTANHIRMRNFRVRVILNGDLIQDRQNHNIDAHFIGATLPTGFSLLFNNFGLKGGFFESWFNGCENQMRI